MKITSLIFAVIVMSLVMASFGMFLSGMSDEYGTTWDNSSIELYNQLNETQTQANELQDKIDTQNTDSSVTDLLGSFVTKAVDSLKLTYRSMGSAMSMTSQATTDLGFPEIFKNAIVQIIIVFVILGVIISVMVKRDV